MLVLSISDKEKRSIRNDGEYEETTEWSISDKEKRSIRNNVLINYQRLSSISDKEKRSIRNLSLLYGHLRVKSQFICILFI